MTILLVVKKGIIYQPIFYIRSTNNTILEKTFTRSKDLDNSLKNAINIWFNIENEPFDVVLHVDGSIELTLKITHAMEIMPTILHWIPHIKVIEPK